MRYSAAIETKVNTSSEAVYAFHDCISPGSIPANR